jgi:hypothetical protein
LKGANCSQNYSKKSPCSEYYNEITRLLTGLLLAQKLIIKAYGQRPGFSLLRFPHFWGGSGLAGAKR